MVSRSPALTIDGNNAGEASLRPVAHAMAISAADECGRLEDWPEGTLSCWGVRLRLIRQLSPFA